MRDRRPGSYHAQSISIKKGNTDSILGPVAGIKLYAFSLALVLVI